MRCILLGTVEGGGYEKMYEEIRRVYSPDGLAPTVTAKKGGHHEVKIATNNSKGYEDVHDGDFINLQYASSGTRRGRIGKQIAQTICCTEEQGVAEGQTNMRIRKLTPLECWRLMDFNDADFYKAQAIESNTQLYAQAGNSIVVNCLVAIFGQMFEGKEHIYEK